MTDEEWRPMVGYEDRYEVSDHGRLRSIGHWKRDRWGGRFFFPGRDLNPGKMKSGHRRVYIHYGGRQHKLLVHRLVLAAFAGPCPEGYECCHRDGDPANNQLSNLYWGTRSENIRDSITHGTHNSAAKGKWTHCRRGHEFTADNTYVHPRNGRRTCRTCRLTRRRDWERERKMKGAAA